MTDLHPLIKIEQLTMRFGGLLAVNAVSIEARQGEITAIIGPNGAGKTTLFNCVTGYYKPSSGQIWLNDQAGRKNIVGLGAQKTASLGIARTFQNIRLFGNMTVLENLMVAQHRQLMPASGYCFKALLNLPSFKKAEHIAAEKALFWLRHMNLLPMADQPAGSLPYGMQRRLEIARAMCTDPRLLCLDEPAAGLNPHESAELSAVLKQIKNEFSVGILLIEHDMSVVMSLSDRVGVMDYGKLIAFDIPDLVKTDPKVLKAYLGEPESGAA